MATGVHGRRKLICYRSSPISKLGSDDLLSEVLIRLPGPKYAFRYKAVCKHWNSLISTPYFSRRFVSHHRTLSAAESESAVLTLSQVLESIVTFLPFPDDRIQSKFSVLDSVKDFILLGFSGREADQELCRTHLLFNPFTKQWLALPLAPEMSVMYSNYYRWIVKLVCEPFDSDCQGEVFSCRFRVVRMKDWRSSSLTASVDVYMFCSTSGRWTEFFLRLGDDLRCCLRYRVVSHSGNLYRLNRRMGVVKWDAFSSDHGALSTLIEGSEFSRHPYGSCYDLWVSEGALHIVFRGRLDLNQYCVWRLEEEKWRGWRKQYEVMSLENLKGTCEISTEKLDLKNVHLIGLHPEKSEITFWRVYGAHCQQAAVLSYDFRKKELKILSYHDHEMFEPRVTLWPNLISSHEQLRNTYNGSYNCWLSPSNESTS